MNRFLLFVTATPLFAQQLTMISGNGQLTLEQFPATQPMVVRAIDGSGRPQANVPVTWSVTRGQGTLRNPQMQTDADGYARSGFLSTSIQPGTSYLQSVVTAAGPAGSVSFFMTTVESSSAGTGQPIIQVLGPPTVRGPAGSTVPEAITVQVAASAGAFLGQGIPNVGVRVVQPVTDNPNAPTAACSGPGGVVLTSDSTDPRERGRAVCNIVLGPNRGTGSFVIFIGDMVNSREFGLEVSAGQSCNVSVSPTSLNLGASGGAATFNVSAVNCAWTATAAAPWITFPGTVSGTGNGQVTANVATNPGAARSALISVGNATVNVMQSAAGTTLPLAFAVGATLPQATAGTRYSFILSVNGGQAPYTWTASGPLPPGMSLDSSTGTVSGTISSEGSYTVPVTVRDAAGTTISQTFTLIVSSGQNPGGNLAFTTTSLPGGVINTPYSQEIRATGGCPNPFFTNRLEIVSGGLPIGLSASSAPSGTGLLIQGTPTQLGSFTFGVRVSDSCGAFITQEFTIQISSTPSTPSLTVSLAELKFTMQAGSATAPAVQNFTVAASSSSLSFTAAASSESNWLAISPESGTTPGSIAARVTNTSLPPGVYRGTVTITAQALNSPYNVPATLTVVASQAPVASPSSLNFVFEPGGQTPLPQTVNITSGGGTVPFTTSVQTASGGSWLSLTQSGGITPASLLVTVNPSGLATGTYTGSITITPAFNLQPLIVPVTLSVGSTAPVISSVTNGASFQTGAIAPGEIVTLFGTGIGPSTLATFQLTPQGTIPDQLAEVRVLFDGLPAPLLYASTGQTTAIVPYGIGGRVSTRVQVEYRGVSSTALDVPVAASAPGLFMSGGTSQGAILNQDSTVNSSTNGAQPGTIVSLYATGEGVTIPPGIAGTIASSALSAPALPVRVTFGGRDAEVLYAGSAPGLPVGMLQVNARLPVDAAAGAVPVVVIVGSASSQSTATVFVRR